MTQVNLDIVSNYVGKGVYQAQRDMAGLTRSIKKVTAALGIGFSTQRIAAFTSASVRAAQQDIKAQRLLANQIRNVGLEFAAANSEAYIQRLQKTQGILDDELRPAYIKFLRISKDVDQSQQLMDLAFNTAAGAGIDYAKAVDIIAKAYQGNGKGLKQLNLGLTQTQMNAMTAGQIFQLMADKFQNAGKQMVTPMQTLSIAFADFKEQWGTAFSEGFLSGTAAKNTVELTDALKGLVPVAKGIGTVVGWAALGLSKWGEAAKFVKEAIAGKKNIAPSIVPKDSAKLTEKYIAQLTKAEKTSIYNNQQMLKSMKAITAQQQKKVALEKLSNLLRSAQKVFDNEAITLAAAAQGKLTDEERARLKLKQDIYDLEQAINDGNVEYATKIAGTLLSDAESLKLLRSGMLSLNGLPDPFEVWLNTIRQILASLAAIPTVASNPFGLGVNAAGFITQNGNQIMPGTDSSGNRVSSVYNYPSGFNPYMATKMAAGGIVTSATPALIGEAGPEAVIPLDRLGSMTSSPIINIKIDPILSGLISVIQEQSASGVSPTVNRISSSYIA